MVFSGHLISKLDLMPYISMIEKVIQQICAIDYLVNKYTFLLFNQFVLLLLLLLLLKKVSSARLGESDIHPIRPQPHITNL